MFTWSGVRALEGDAGAKPSRISRSPGSVLGRQRSRRLRHPVWRQAHHPPGPGRGGARRASQSWRRRSEGPGPRTSRSTAELSPGLSCSTAPRAARRAFLWRRAGAGRSPMATDRDAVRTASPPTLASAEEIAPGVTRAELEYAVEIEDALTAEDFLLRRTKLHLLLDEPGPRRRGALVRGRAG